jgi:uncharacterized membrane protein YccC
VQGFGARLRDPHRINLRKAGRAAIVVPAMFAAFVIAGDEPAALFAAFGSFAALVFADFGGPRGRRFRAYVGLAGIGVVLLTLGTAFADTIWPAVVVTLVVAFVVPLTGALGGYFAAGTVSATLAFVLAVMSPVVDADLAARDLGWVVGVMVAGVAAITMWPVHQRDRVRAAAARVLREAAAAVLVPSATRDLHALRAADAALTTRAGVVYRPAGSITRERALVALVIVARRMLPLLERITTAERSAAADATPEYAALEARVSESLRATADVVEREVGSSSGDGALARARAEHTAALERWAQTAVARDGAARVVDGFTATFPLRRLSLAAMQAADDADDAARDGVRSPADGEALLAKGWAMVRAHCNVRSVRFRNATRSALGLALAVLVAKIASVDHAFWVVLGALSVLRSNALGTGATALQALAGALIGFGVASLVMTTIGADDAWLWVVLPVVVFLAAYTPGAVNFVVGQAGFTVFVVVLFNVLVPDGWRTGLVRVQDVAIGAGISVVVGALLWPRGARGVARRSFAELLRAAADHLGLALDAALHDGRADLAAAADAVADARARAVAALEDLALERGGGHVDRVAWGNLLVEALMLEVAAAGIVRARDPRHRAALVACGTAVAALDRTGGALGRALQAEAELLVAGRESAQLSELPHDPAPEVASCLAGSCGGDLAGAISLLWIDEWLLLAASHAVADAPAGAA